MKIFFCVLMVLLIGLLLIEKPIERMTKNELNECALNERLSIEKREECGIFYMAWEEK